MHLLPEAQEIPSTSNTQLKSSCIKLFLLGLSIGIIYLLLIGRTIIFMNTATASIQPRAYIITTNCSSVRFNATKQNIERVFPKFFNIVCFLTIPLNDPRVHTSSSPLFQKWSSNLLAFIDLWTYEIPKYSQNNDLEWSFIFEDDVNFCHPSIVLLPNFIEPLQEIMQDPVVHRQDGFFYLGICGPQYNNYSQLIVSKNTNKLLISRKGYGFCLHATAITARRSRIFWGQIASYRPNANEKPLDYQLRMFSIRSKSHFYIFGNNFHYPPDTEHFGVAYQDRKRFASTMS